MTETWRPVVAWEDRYEVSDLGRVRRTGAARGAVVGRILRASAHRPYLMVALRSGTTQRSRCVHILVCEAFHGARPPGAEVRHLDGDRRNNRADNLTWGSRSENMRDAVRHGTHRSTVKTSCLRGHRLVPPNLRAADALKGQRSCLSCDRANTRVWRNPSLDLVATADSIYRELMGEASCPR